MSGTFEPQRLAVLWQLAWKDSMVTCAIYRDEQGLQLRVESPTAVVITERFELQPRAVARARTLCESLKRRGWEEVPHGLPIGEAGDAPVV
jgi:hypothetical protein